MNGRAGVLRIDAHSHLYPAYPLVGWVDAAIRNLTTKSDGSDVSPVVFVADREGQDAGTLLESSGLSVSRVAGELGRSVERNGRALLVVRGVQYVSNERIEVLGLGVARSRPDGGSARELINAVRLEGGIACLPWSPGKWLGQRGRVVRSLMDEFGPSDITLGDIAIRSRVGPPSSLVSAGRKEGFRILFGSDPLPAASEYNEVGRFGLQLPHPQLSVESTARWLLEALGDPNTKYETFGCRNAPLHAALRMYKGLTPAR